MRPILFAAAALLAAACASTNPSRDYQRPTETSTPAEASTGAAASERRANADEPARRTAEDRERASTPVEAAVDVVPAPVAARVAGEDVLVGELLAFWLHNRSVEVREMLEHLVSAKLILLESRRLGVEVDDDLIDLGLTRTRQEMEKQIRREDPSMSFREFVEVRLGLDAERYESQMRWEVERKLLGERVVRAFVLGQPRTELNVIVVRSKEDADAAMARLDAGEEFSALARELSLDPSARLGGRIPPVLRNGSSISELAFGTQVGRVGGPLEQDGSWLIAEVVARPEPLAGGWPEIREAVEDSLREHPLDDPEYWQWKSEMVRRYKVDLTPFFELVDEPAL